jgi:hypothetical protein
MPTETPVRTEPAPAVPYTPDPETLTPERLCPAQKERITRSI